MPTDCVIDTFSRSLPSGTLGSTESPVIPWAVPTTARNYYDATQSFQVAVDGRLTGNRDSNQPQYGLLMGILAAPACADDMEVEATYHFDLSTEVQGQAGYEMGPILRATGTGRVNSFLTCVAILGGDEPSLIGIAEVFPSGAARGVSFSFPGGVVAWSLNTNPTWRLVATGPTVELSEDGSVLQTVSTAFNLGARLVGLVIGHCDGGGEQDQPAYGSIDPLIFTPPFATFWRACPVSFPCIDRTGQGTVWTIG